MAFAYNSTFDLFYDSGWEGQPKRRTREEKLRIFLGSQNRRTLSRIVFCTTNTVYCIYVSAKLFVVAR